jgi:acetoin utilization protein AcuC
MALRLLVVHDDGLGMRFGGDHPIDARRHRLAVALCREAGLLNGGRAALEPAPGPLPDEELARVFAPAFIRAVRRYSDQPVLAAEPEARQWGIGGDNNAYPGMHEDSARACAACAAAARAVAGGRARAALVPAAGAHHGTAAQAQGFGIYNETAVAVRTLLDAGLGRVAYVDLDVHHGNGTQWIFYDEPRVLTVSVHESGRHLFPGSGFPAETGGAAAPGSAANVALPPFAGDGAYRAAWERVVAPVVRAFAPDAIVAQCGVDHHHADPLSHLLTTMPLYRELWTRLRKLAEEACGGRLVALGGGGYEPCTAPPRAWAGLAAELAGERVEGDVPESWRAIAREAGCPEPARGWWEDAGPAPDSERDRRAEAEAEAAVGQSVAALDRFWGIAR